MTCFTLVNRPSIETSMTPNHSELLLKVYGVRAGDDVKSAVRARLVA